MIYLDNHATTPCDPRVLEVMLPYFGEQFANPSSITHKAGRSAANAIEKARNQVAELIGARTKEVIFTSGATESNNLAILGIANFDSNKRRKIVISSIEHKAVISPSKYLEKHGFELTILPVDNTGGVDKNEAQKAIDQNTCLVSIQTANNEIGTIQDILFFSRLAHENGAYFHTDAAQAVGKIHIDVDDLEIDLLSISSHKMYGPKGVGSIFIRGGAFALPINPLFFGGGQEDDVRPGTYNVPGIIGLGKAALLCKDEMKAESSRITELRNQLEGLLISNYPNTIRNGDLQNRLPGNISLTLPGIDAEALIANLPNLSLSAGSACTSGSPSPSHVLLAIGRTREEAHQTIRIGLGRFTTHDEILVANEDFIHAIKRISEISHM